MPAYFDLDAPVRFFTHEAYGRRLLFVDGPSNPRNRLGKNGVTFHEGLGSYFFKTIAIRLLLLDKEGKSHPRVFHINRQSLIKYLGVPSKTADVELVAQLKQTLWTKKSPEERRAAQAKAGESLRHAGEYNKSLVNQWWSDLVARVKGSFLGWLYQKTISAIHRLKARFFIVSSEKQLLEAGETLARKRFLDAYESVPAYRQHVSFNGRSVKETSFSDIPVTNKANYITYQQHDMDTHQQGIYPYPNKTDTSTGTTGKPTVWVRGVAELETVKKSLQLAAKLQFGQRKLAYINAFALGPWATGLTTYELMRDTGSVFATGADKEKIVDQLNAIYKAEKCHRERVVAANFPEHWHKTINAFLKKVLQDALRNRTAHFEKILKDNFTELTEAKKLLFEPHLRRIFAVARSLNQEQQQIIIAGYPPFLKDLVNYARQKGIKFEKFAAIGVVGGQAISEAMRDTLVADGFTNVYSSYGASDLDINLGIEGDEEQLIRKALEGNPDLAREFYGANKGVPMVFHFDPMNYHVECVSSKEADGEESPNHLVYTCTRNDRSSPRIRYDLGDKGRVYAASDVQALLAKHGIFFKPRTALPLLFVWGRDSTVVYNGANLAFTELERAITMAPALKDSVLKKAFYTYEDAQGREQIELWLELQEGVDLPEASAAQDNAAALLQQLAELNQDFRYQLEALSPGDALPVVRFFKRGHSPISEADGHRKQVLIFNKHNLPLHYQFPDEAVCCAIRLESNAPRLVENAGVTNRV